MSTPDELLADAPLGAAVAALAERNRHHLEQMTDAERADALRHWHDLAVAVLTAAGAALGGEENGDSDAQGRAVIVLEDVLIEDAGEAQVAVHASFFPQLEDRRRRGARHPRPGRSPRVAGSDVARTRTRS